MTLLATEIILRDVGESARIIEMREINTGKCGLRIA